jgi:CRISPR-associated protein Csm1
MEGGSRGAVVEFSALADRAPASYLGILRMDVDDLGAIMSRGLPRPDRTLSKVAALSRTVSWFFGAYLDTIADSHDLYVTYAGGDDLFIVGPWDGILEAAVEVRNAFSAYACDNPDLHLSGALWICKGKFPVGRAAGYAGQRLEELAKTLRDLTRAIDDTDKNALAVFETKVPWDTLVRVKELADNALIPAVRDGRLPRAFIYFLVNLYQHFIQSRPGRRGGASLQWIPKLRYALTRNVKDQTLAARVWSELPGLQHYLGVLASYVSLSTRDVGVERR